MLLSTGTLAQIAYYDGLFGAGRRQKVSLPGTAVFLALGLASATYGVATKLRRDPAIDVLYFLSYIKMTITFVKYLPQLRDNYRRKSTVGWSIHNILLDFTGGALSTLQLVLDCWDTRDWSGIVGDVAKFALGSISIVFDIMFMVQHYVLYPTSKKPPSANAPLLDPTDGALQ